MTDDDIRSALGHLQVGMGRIEEKVDGLKGENVKADSLHADHEQRLRVLEAVRWKIAGWAAALGAIGGGGVVTVLSRLLDG